MTNLEADINLTDFKKDYSIDKDTKPHALNFRLNGKFNVCNVVVGLAYDICGLDKNLVELCKVERGMSGSDIRLYISPVSLYANPHGPSTHSKDLICFKDNGAYELFRAMVEGMVVNNPESSSVWKFALLNATMTDPITLNTSRPEYAITKFLCPVEVEKGEIYLPSGLTTPTIVRKKHASKKESATESQS